jgi:asparagine synthase (glutamine-hydrolysing)
MCGLIAGIGKVSLATLDKAVTTLTHRGPESSATWVSDNQSMFLGHTRLSIIGLDNGAQPISNADGNVHIVVNGEFYGYKDIRNRLLSEGVAFKTESDSEIALHLYLRYGLQALKELRGEFSIVIADERQNCLIAIRDRFGIKPLFYTIHQGAVYFASEIKALLALGVPARWDLETAFYDGFLFRDHARTLFKDIWSVPQGQYAIATPGDLRLYTYWDWDFPTEAALSIDGRSDEECIEEFRAILMESIQDRLVADVPVACYLSGGIDSCAVLGFAQQGLSRPIECYTLAFDDELYNEAPIAEKQAAFAGANYNPIIVGRKDLAAAYSDAVWHAETPFVNANGVAKFLLSRAVNQRGIKVVLTGEGADEMLGGYLPFKRDAILQHGNGRSEAESQAMIDQIFESNPAARAIFMREGADDPAIKEVATRLGWVPSFMETYGQLGRISSGLYRDEMMGGIHPSSNPFTYVMDRLPVSQALDGRSRLNQALYLNSKTHMANFILTFLGDRMEMAHSVEGRVPMLDHLT